MARHVRDVPIAEVLTVGDLLETGPVHLSEEARDTRTPEDLLIAIHNIFEKFFQGSNEKLRESAKAFMAYFDTLGFDTPGNDPIFLDPYHMFSTLDKHWLEGDFNEFPWGKGPVEFMSTINHLYAKSKFIAALPVGYRMLDSSGTISGDLFNREDVVYTWDEEDKKAPGGWIINIALVDMKARAFRMSQKKPEMHIAGIRRRFGNFPNVTYTAEEYKLIGRPVVRQVRNVWGNNGAINRDLTLPPECLMPLEMASIFSKELKEGVIRQRVAKRAVLKEIKRAMGAVEETKRMPFSEQEINVLRATAMGDGSDADRAWVMKKLADTPRYTAYMEILKKVCKYITGAIMHGLPVPDATKPSHILGDGGHEIRDPRYDLTANKLSYSVFFYRLATEELMPDTMLVLFDARWPSEIGYASRALFRGGVYADGPYAACGFRIGGVTLRRDGEEIAEGARETGANRYRNGVVRCGFRYSGDSGMPKNFCDLMGREGRHRFDSVYGKEADSREKAWTSVKFDNDKGIEQIAGWMSDMEGVVKELGRQQAPQTNSRMNDCLKTLSLDQDKAMIPGLSKGLASQMLAEMSSTIGEQMLEMQVQTCEQVMAAATHKGDKDTLFISMDATKSIMWVIRTVAPVQKFTGSSVVVFVARPTPYIGGNYEDLSWNGKNRENIAVSKCLSYFKKQIAHASHCIDRTAVYLTSHHMHLAGPNLIDKMSHKLSIDHGMIGHLCAQTINPTRNESVALSVGRWLTQIMAGQTGSAADIAKKADTGVFMTQLSAYSVAQTLLRCGAVALLRDARDYKWLFPEATDGMRTVHMAPTFATGRAKFPKSREPFVSMQQSINNWYTCEVFTGTHGNMISAGINAVQLVMDIVEKAEQADCKRRRCGVGDFAYNIWMANKDMPPAVRRAAILDAEYDDPPGFWSSEASFVEKIVTGEFQKGTVSILAVVEGGLGHALPEETWAREFTNAARSSTIDIHTDKRALQRHDEFNKREGLTVAAAKGFLPGMVPTLDRLSPETLMATLTDSNSLRSASVLACALRSLGDGRNGTFTIVNKADSVEKDRCIAIMDHLMRYPALLIETILEGILKSRTPDKESMGMKPAVPTSVLEVKDKVYPLMQAMDEVKAKVADLYSKSKSGESPSMYTSARVDRVLKLMNDASSWGPWKDLPSMYATVVAMGADEETEMVVLETIKMFMQKEMVMHSSMQPPVPESKKGMKDQRTEARMAKETRRKAEAWRDAYARYLD